MIPEISTFTCKLHWTGNNDDYDSFPRLHSIALPGGAGFTGGAAHNIQNPAQTNPEELFAASLGTCMMMTILAVFSRSRVPVVEYVDSPEAILQLVERRYRITKVLLRPTITLRGEHDHEKLKTLIEKSHANCFIAVSIKSEVVIEPTFVTV